MEDAVQDLDHGSAHSGLAHPILVSPEQWEFGVTKLQWLNVILLNTVTES